MSSNSQMKIQMLQNMKSGSKLENKSHQIHILLVWNKTQTFKAFKDFKNSNTMRVGLRPMWKLVLENANGGAVEIWEQRVCLESENSPHLIHSPLIELCLRNWFQFLNTYRPFLLRPHFLLIDTWMLRYVVEFHSVGKCKGSRPKVASGDVLFGA